MKFDENGKGTPTSLHHGSKEAGDLSSSPTISTDLYPCWGGCRVPFWPQFQLADL